MLKTNNITKDFGSEKGIFQAEIEIGAGQIVGLIGPNGAGKSTLINCISGLYYPTSGNFELFQKIANPLNISEFLPKMGIMLSEISELPHLNADQILNRYFKLQKDKLDSALTTNFDFSQEIKRLSELFEIQTNKPFSKLSLGNKKKIAIVKTLAHKPKLVILDEPTSGLDPLIQKKLLAELVNLKNQGGSVFLSSHVLKEVEDVCDTIIMVKNGKIISQNQTKELLENSYKIVSLPLKFLDKVNSLKLSDIEIQENNHTVVIKTNNILPFIELANAYHIQDLLITKPSLEELFLEKY